MPFNSGFAASPNGGRNASISVNFVTNFGGVGNGVTNNSTSLVSFNTFSVPQTTRVDLIVPSGTYAVSSNNGQFFGAGIASYTMEGVGSSASVFALALPAAPLFVGGFGQVDDGVHNGKIASDVSSGATSFTLSTPSDASRMPVGSKICITGLAIQGVAGANFGFPTNAQFFDYVTVTSASTITGIISFTPPVTDSYKVSWPLISSGSSTGQPQGGPAWAYVMSSTWNTQVQINDIGFTYDTADVTTYGNGYQFNYNRCSWASGSGKGPSPSQNLSATFSNCNLFTPVSLEVDKLITNLVFDGCPINNLAIQSASIKNLTIQNSSNITAINGLPRTSIISNNTIGTLKFGPSAYGCADSAQVNNNVITTWGTAVPTNALTDNNLQMSGGIITTPRQVAVLGCSDNGSGKVRLTVADTTRLATSMSMNANGLFVTGSQNIPYNITVVSSILVDILSLNSSSVTWTSSGYLANQAVGWAVPNRWANMTGASGVYGNFKITSVTESSDVWFIQTSLSSNWPSGITGVQSHPCPAYSGTGNTGCPEALEASMSGAQNKPIYSYVNRTYTNSLTASGTAARPIMWGVLASSDAMTVNVTTPYTGGTATLTWAPTQFTNQIPVLRSSVVTNLNMVINAKVAGARVYNGITGTWSGASSGDTLPTFAVGDRLMGTFISSPILSVSVSSESAGPVINWEVKTDQGIT